MKSAPLGTINGWAGLPERSAARAPAPAPLPAPASPGTSAGAPSGGRTQNTCVMSQADPFHRTHLQVLYLHLSHEIISIYTIFFQSLSAARELLQGTGTEPHAALSSTERRTRPCVSETAGWGKRTDINATKALKLSENHMHTTTRGQG